MIVTLLKQPLMMLLKQIQLGEISTFRSAFGTLEKIVLGLLSTWKTAIEHTGPLNELMSSRMN